MSDTTNKFYLEHLAMREEILKHKWLESEKVGEDIGFEQAMMDWFENHRDEWLKNRNK